MSKIPALSDPVPSGRISGLLLSLNRTVRGSWLIRCIGSLTALLLTTCDSLWTQYRETNPINCILNPGICPEGQVCNSQTRLCRVPQLTLVAGAIGGPGNA
ncbi:MAG TPA: hypothetical protein PKI03_17045, partial [Pseudomonadota bacterium]|nr:hypothetical protein [Pseudomonadota bacterium]